MSATQSPKLYLTLTFQMFATNYHAISVGNDHELLINLQCADNNNVDSRRAHLTLVIISIGDHYIVSF